MVDSVRVTVAADGEQSPEDEARTSALAKFMALARQRFRSVVAAESKLRERQLDDKRFRASEQWDSDSIAERQTDRRPYLTINRLGQFVRQVTNSQRQANLSVKVVPVDDGSDIDTARVFQGIIRHIEDRSDASVAYTTGGDDQATIGRGWWRIVAEYTGPRSFTQDLRIKRIRNAFSVYQDPASQELDGSDARFLFIIRDIPKDEYIARWGDEAYASLVEFCSTGNNLVADWMPEGAVRVAEYWYVETEDERIHLVRMRDGSEQVIADDDLKIMTEAIEGAVPWQIVSSRDSERRTVRTAIINAQGVLDGNEDKTGGRKWPGKWIPVVPIIGDEIDINGEVDLRGMIRDAKDPQRLYNFQNTALAETLGQAPMTQWVGYAGQFENHEKKWNQINRRRFPYVEVNPTSYDGQVLPLPSRITSEPPIQAIVQAIKQADNDLKATTGLYDPSLGERSSQQSGKAISFLQRQGELANSNFTDNMARSIRATGRMLVDLIPHYYDAPRVVRILGEDDEQRAVMVHRGRADEVPAQLPPGVEKIYDLSAGEFDVTVSVGPGRNTRRAEAAEALSQFVQAYPAAFPILGDLIVKNMDWPGAQAASARLKKLVPAQFRDDNEMPQVPPEVQAQMEQLSQQLQMAMAKVQEYEALLKGKQMELEMQGAIKRLDIESRERIAELNAKISLLETEARTESQESIVRLRAEVSHLEKQLQHAHERGMERMRMAHEASQADVDDQRHVRDRAVDAARDVELRRLQPQGDS